MLLNDKYSLNDNGKTSNDNVLPLKLVAISLLKSFEFEPVINIFLLEDYTYLSLLIK